MAKKVTSPEEKMAKIVYSHVEKGGISFDDWLKKETKRLHSDALFGDKDLAKMDEFQAFQKALIRRICLNYINENVDLKQALSSQKNKEQAKINLDQNKPSSNL